MGCRSGSMALLVAGALLLGISVVVHVTSGSAGARRPKNKVYPMHLASASPRSKCWVFNHMNKAGGSTIKYMLTPYAEKRNISTGLYDSLQWQEGEQFAKDFLHANYTLTWGSYAEGLRRHGERDCKWFTVFRHPVPRLVSAYFYCKKSPVDGLCASKVLLANDTDLVTFAEHWSNFGLRQFSLAFVVPEDMAPHDLCPIGKKGKNVCPGWYMLKLHLEQLYAEEQAGVSKRKATALKSVAMYDMLQPVEELLSRKYAAVGILEQWATTMRLFNVALKLPQYDWPSAFQQIGKKNSDGTFRTEEGEALRTAWTDPAIKKYLWLDLLLYDHAVSVHNRQLSEYGLA